MRGRQPGTAERGINDKKRNAARATSTSSRHGFLPRPNNNSIRIAVITTTTTYNLLLSLAANHGTMATAGCATTQLSSCPD